MARYLVETPVAGTILLWVNASDHVQAAAQAREDAFALLDHALLSHAACEEHFLTTFCNEPKIVLEKG